MFPMFAFIPWLAGLLSSLIAFFASYMAKTWAIKLAVISGLIALTLAFTAFIHSTILSIATILPGGYVSLGMSLLPGNTSVCMGAYVTSYVARWVYDYHAGFMARWIDQGL